MLVGDTVGCPELPCDDVLHSRFTVSPLRMDPRAIRCVMVCEAPAPEPGDDFYAPGRPFFLETTAQAFARAGVAISAMEDVLALGVYVTTAIKCAKSRYPIPRAAVKTCSHLLEAELGLFPGLRVILAMGDVAIRAINEVGRRRTGHRVIPAGSTYKLRGSEYHLGPIRVLPSFLPTGKSFVIERSRQRMVAEDIRTALDLIRPAPLRRA